MATHEGCILAADDRAARGIGGAGPPIGAAVPAAPSVWLWVELARLCQLSRRQLRLGGVPPHLPGPSVCPVPRTTSPAALALGVGVSTPAPLMQRRCDTELISGLKALKRVAGGMSLCEDIQRTADSDCQLQKVGGSGEARIL